MSLYQTSKSGLMFFIYLHMESYQRLLPFFSSNSFASFTDLNILTPNLCIRNQYFDLSFQMMQLHFSSTYRIHYTNSGSPAIWRCTAYSAIYTGYKFFISLRVAHIVLPSFHCKRNSTPFVVSLRHFVPVRVVMNASCYFTSVPSYLWSKISWNRKCRFPSPSTDQICSPLLHWPPEKLFSRPCTINHTLLYPGLDYFGLCQLATCNCPSNVSPL